MFAAEYENTTMDGRRRAPRAPVSLDASLGLGGLARALCKVVDISIHGARLQSYSTLTRGSTIWLTLPGIGPVAADIMWSDEFVAGCQFHRPLDPAVIEDLAKRPAPRA